VLYWLKIYALVGVLVFSGAGVVIIGLFVWCEGESAASAEPPCLGSRLMSELLRHLLKRVSVLAASLRKARHLTIGISVAGSSVLGNGGSDNE